MSCIECGRTDSKIRRGLCNACYKRHRHAGELDQAALPTTRHSDRILPASYVASEWAWLSTFGVDRDRAAHQLGMTRSAFDKALDRDRKNHRQETAA